MTDKDKTQSIINHFKDGSATSSLRTTSPEEDQLRHDIMNALATVRREAREESQQRVFAEAIRQGVGAIKAATIASAALERATDSQIGGE